ncbi:MAG: hypothetical protein WC859_10095 [Elusimicrobiota bacterium]|jgi:hypothetical protein
MATADTVATEASAAYNDAKALADSSLAKADTALSNAAAAANGLSTYSPGGMPVDLTIAEVVPEDVAAPLLPTTDFTTDVKDAFDYAFGTFNQSLQGQILNFLDAFFPDIAAGVKTGSDQWIIDTIANGSFMPAAVETAIWNRAKDREVQEALRAEAAVVDAAASRGFYVAPGVVNDGVNTIQLELSKKLTSINRDITIKAFDVANENTKFAIQQAVALRTAFVSAMGDFIKVAMVQPNNAVEYAKVILAAKTGLYDSAVRLYSAKIEEEKMRSSVALENVNNATFKPFELNIRNFESVRGGNIDKAKIQADAALSAADQLAKVAASALSTRNTMLSVSAGV